MPTSSDHLMQCGGLEFHHFLSVHDYIHPPLLPSALTKHPWEKVAFDLFEFKGKQVPSSSGLVFTQFGSYSTYYNNLFQCDILHEKHLLQTWNPTSDNGPRYNSTEI